MTMRFMVMHKQDKDSEAGVPPSQELMAGMGKFTAEGIKAGVFLSGEGLQPSSKRARLNFSGGKRTVTNGPFTGSNELIAGFAMLKVKSKEEAIEWASRFAKVVGDVEIEVGQVKEPWDLGLCPKPEGDVTMRFLVMHKADKDSEAGVPPTPELMAEMEKLTEEMVKAGVFLSADGFEPSSKSVRLNFSGGKRSVIDGPFTESKELVGGFAMVQVKSKEEAIEWASQFAKVLYDAKVVGDVEIDVRQVREVSEFR
jgi:hypothetical protein